jgi:hypothetical protein
MYKEYLELIYRWLSDDIHTELTCIRISYGEITCVYGKVHMTVMWVIFILEITKLSYVKKILCSDHVIRYPN